MTSLGTLFLSWCLLVQKPGLNGWKEYTPPDQTFKVLMPENFTESKSEGEPLPSFSLRAEIAGKKSLQMDVIWYDFPKTNTFVTVEAARRFLRGAVDEHISLHFIAKPGEKRGTTKELFLGEVPGIEITGETAEGQHVRDRAYLWGTRGYQIFLAADDRETVDSPDASRFFDSFQILKSPGVPAKAGAPTNSNRASGDGLGLIIATLVLVLLVVVFIGFSWSRSKLPREMDRELP